MKDLNSICVNGMLAMDADIKGIKDDLYIVTLLLSVSNGKNSQGEWKPSDLLKACCFVKNPEIFSNLFLKGCSVSLNGRLHIDRIDTANGKKEFHKIMCDSMDIKIIKHKEKG